MTYRLERLNGRHGAPLGRAYRKPSGSNRWHLRFLGLDSGGYDAGGAYWGRRPEGIGLWHACEVDGEGAFYVDAPNRLVAAAKLLEEHDGATLVRAPKGLPRTLEAHP